MASISSNDYSDSGALPSSSTSGSSDHPPNPKRQNSDGKSTDHQRSFKEKWRKQYFVIPHPTTSGQCICLVCLTVFNQFKVYTIKRHFESKHKNLMGQEPDGGLTNMRGCFLLTTKNVRYCLGLSQLLLDNALCIGLETREPSDFPFEQLFHYIKN